MSIDAPDWRFTVPGQPLSWNHAYKRVTYRKRKADGSGMDTFNRMGKVDGVEKWQDGIAKIAKAARPSGWVHPRDTPIRIRYWYYVNPSLDTDNMKKLVNDALAKAIGINDRWFRTCDVLVEKVPDGQQRMVIEISNEAGHS
jgi:Holliday junction resolvase RusA-like endonuclease